MPHIPKLYDELADWWQCISPTSDYVDEAAFIGKLFRDNGTKTILELGAGGGNVAWHLKREFELTLTDIAPRMLAMSQKQNPDCEHIVADMRTVNLGRTFDGVLIHDASMYLTTEAELRQTITQAALHCKSGGLIVLAPDCTRENFKVGVNHEGHTDATGRSAHYLEWTSDPDPNDTEFEYDFVIGLKDKTGLRAVVDRQHCGIFPRATWLRLLEKVGCSASAIPDPAANENFERVELFLGKKR